MKLKRKETVQATIQEDIILQGLSIDDMKEIKDELTFDNPEYANVKKYSRYSYTRVSPSLFYFKLLSNHRISVPIGFDVSKYTHNIKDNRVYFALDTFPKFNLTLRDEQEIAANAYLEANSGPELKGSIQLPTGKGKSILALYLASIYKTKTLVVVHKDDLVKGWRDDIALCFPEMKVGLIKAKSRVVGDYITIATVQTLNRLSEEELSELYQTFGFVIQDEMHHCPASSFGIVSKFNARYKLGLTATPERSDGLAHVMKLYFGDFCYKYKAKSAKEEKDILPVKVITRTIPMSLIPLCKKSGKSYVISDLSYSGARPTPTNTKLITDIPYADRPRVQFQSLDDVVVRSIIEAVCHDIVSEYNKGRSCIAFFTLKEHCRLYQEFLHEEMEVPLEDIGLYYGDNPDNEAVRNKAENQRKFITLATYAKATEGTNVKQWEVEFLVSSINNGKNVEQAAGRVRRIKGGKISTALIYDYRFPHVYSFSSHGATRDQRYSELNFQYPTQNRSLFTRGYNR